MSRFLHRIGGGAARRPWWVIGAWLLTTAVVLGLAGTFGGALSDDNTIPGSDSQKAYDLLRERFPQMAGADARPALGFGRDSRPGQRLGPMVEALRTLWADLRPRD